MPQSFNDVIHGLLEQKGKPIEIFDLVDMALVIKPLKAHPDRLAQEIYRLALKPDSNVVVTEYPYFAIRNYANKPALTRGTVSAAYNAIRLKRGNVELRDLVQHAKQQGFLASSTNVPEYWVYLKLKERRDVFIQRGALRIGLKQPHAKPAPQKTVSPVAKAKVIKKLPAQSKTDVTANIHEANLESILVEQLDKIEPGLQLIQRQYHCPDVGRIDLLCKDKRGNLVVIELKKFGVKTNSIIDQITGYMGFIKTQVAKYGQAVRGIIVVGKADARLHYAVAAIPGVEIKTFNVSIQ
jgi:hypothetical protein